MNTLADLKRKLKVGQGIKLVDYKDKLASNNSRLNVVRYVVKVQGNGVYLNPDRTATKGSFLELPKASLMEMNETGFKTFIAGLRDLTTEEQEIMKNEPQDAKQDEIDLISDGSVMFYRRKRYYTEKGFEYLLGYSKVIRGLHYDYNTKKVRDESIKGDMSLSYEFVE